MNEWLPMMYFFIMGLAMLVYVVLDGYDLGIGLLLPLGDDDQKDQMISTIGPFWDANETWIVLGVGILLTAFPHAHGIILGKLYLPVTVMLVGLILRGVAFEFRVKANPSYKVHWDRCFFAGSLLASTAQGWMLGSYVTGLVDSPMNTVFSSAIAITLPALYIMLGSAWLLLKTEGALFSKALQWARNTLAPMAAGLALISLATPLVSESIALKWFSVQNFLGLLPIPLSCGAALLFIWGLLRRPDRLHALGHHCVFFALVLICMMASIGLAYSLFPYIIIEKMTLWEAAAYTESLQFLSYGVAITVPLIMAYTAFTYYVFRGKATSLSYGKIDPP